MIENSIPELNARFLKVVEALGHTGYSFSAKMDISQATFSYIRSGRRKPSIELIQKLVEDSPELNLHWLVQGSGKMFRRDEADRQSQAEGNAQLDRIEILLRELLSAQYERITYWDTAKAKLEERMQAVGESVKGMN